jgi:hypothetical protein
MRVGANGAGLCNSATFGTARIVEYVPAMPTIRSLVAVAVTAISSVAVAQAPGDVPSHAPLTRTETVSMLDLALRGGVHITDRGMLRGTGPAFDLEVGVRLRPWLSLAWFLGYSSFEHVVVTAGIDNEGDRANIGENMIDYGLRASLHARSCFAGLGFGGETIWATSDSVDILGTDGRLSFTEVHAGCSWNHIDGIALATRGYGMLAQDSARFMIGWRW